MDVKAKVQEMISARSCCAELKAAGKYWLDAVGTDKEQEAKKALLSEIDEDIIPIDGLIAFAGSENAIKIFGEQGAKDMLAHAKEIKMNGALYCDCPACACALEIKNALK